MNRKKREEIRKQLRIKFVGETLHSISFHETCDLVNYSTMEIDDLRSQLTAALAERDEARERVKELEGRVPSMFVDALDHEELKMQLEVMRRERDRLAAQVDTLNRCRAEDAHSAIQRTLIAEDTAWQQSAEAMREAAANVCYERAQNQGSNQCRYAGDDIFVLPVPERKEG